VSTLRVQAVNAMASWTGGASLAITLTIALTGCGPGTKQLYQPITAAISGPLCPGPDTVITGGGSLFFPAPVCDTYKINGNIYTSSGADDHHVGLEWAAAALSDSEEKCTRYINGFTGSQAAENTGFDVAALILTGLATVFTPANTVRALAASSTAVQGTKAAINTDLFQQMTVMLLVQQINTTYFTQLEDYTKTLPANTINSISASVAYTKIVNIHRLCSIPFAVASISQTQKTAASGAAVPAKIDVTKLASGTNKFKGKSGNIYVLTISTTAPRRYALQIQFSIGTLGPAETLDATTVQNILTLDEAQPAN